MTKLDHPIPAAALDDRLGWGGTIGSGKTYDAGGGVERLLAEGARVVIVDSLDISWGLRLTADSQTAPAGEPVVIFGEANGDLPLSEHHGGLIGETAASMRESCVVSLGGLTTKASERSFMLAFVDAIYLRADATKSEPFHIVFDEADLWAPQKPSKPMLQSRMEEIVRRGRIMGFIPWMITQRPAVLSKDVLSQVDGLVAFKLTSSQDRDAIGAWIEGQADKAQGREILAKLPTMQRGQGVVWIPGRGALGTASFPPKATFDSSRTPERGADRASGSALKALDLSHLKERLAAVEQDTKASDPDVLKAQVARLTRELAQIKRQAAAFPPPAAAAPPAGDEAALEEARRQGEAAGIAIGFARAQAALAALRVDGAPAPAHWASRSPAKPRAANPLVLPVAGVTASQQRILNALAWWRALGLAEPTNEQVGFLAGYASGSGNFSKLKSGMSGLGLIRYPAAGRLALTQLGIENAEAPALELTMAAFHARVRAKLTAPQVRLLNPVLAAYPDPISSEAVAAAAGYAAGSGNFSKLRGALRSVGLIDHMGAGRVRAADWLFPEAP